MIQRLIITAVLVGVSAVAVVVSRASQASPSKPIHVTRFHTEGGPGTPATLGALWNLADTVALVEIAGATPDVRTARSRQSNAEYTTVKTLYQSNVIELFKSVDPSPVSIDIETMGGTVDRGSFVEERRNDRLPPLKSGARYFVFLRWLPKEQRYLPATADANSFLRVNAAGGLLSDGDAPLAKQLAQGTADALTSSLRQLKGGH